MSFFFAKSQHFHQIFTSFVFFEMRFLCCCCPPVIQNQRDSWRRRNHLFHRCWKEHALSTLKPIALLYVWQCWTSRQIIIFFQWRKGTFFFFASVCCLTSGRCLNIFLFCSIALVNIGGRRMSSFFSRVRDDKSRPSSGLVLICLQSNDRLDRPPLHISSGSLSPTSLTGEEFIFEKNLEGGSL